MNALIEIGIHILRTLGSLYLLLVLLRFLLQWVRADFYNPISQGISKATNPLLLPLRRLVPGLYGIDIASLVLALIVHWFVLQLMLFILGLGIVNPGYLFIWGIIGILKTFVSIYFYGMFIYIIASWIAPFSSNPALVLLKQIILPAVEPLRKIIPPLGPIDLSPMAFIFGLQLISAYIVPSLSQTLAQALTSSFGGAYILTLGF